MLEKMVVPASKGKHSLCVSSHELWLGSFLLSTASGSPQKRARSMDNDVTLACGLRVLELFTTNPLQVKFSRRFIVSARYRRSLSFIWAVFREKITS